MEESSSLALDFAAINKSTLQEIDRFMKSASFSAFKKGIQNVGIVSCFYSLNIQQYNINDFIFTNPGRALRLIVPVIHGPRIVLMVFFSEDNRVEYYDSLKQDFCEQFHPVKDAVEKFVNLKFNLTNQKVINESINDNLFPLLANVHICRIAEELCFLKRYRKLDSFDINEEAKRIKAILDMASDEKWNGEWIFNLKDKRIDTVFDKNFANSEIVSSSPANTDTVGSIIEINNEKDSVIPSSTQREITINSIINDVVNSVNKSKPSNNTVDTENNETAMIENSDEIAATCSTTFEVSDLIK
uniref:Uncharacterized protein n=1 Tax=Panagrolaimus sp. ES5 TaxID=591445 RepID=A0AC34GY87_9BILA